METTTLWEPKRSAHLCNQLGSLACRSVDYNFFDAAFEKLHTLTNRVHPAAIRNRHERLTDDILEVGRN